MLFRARIALVAALVVLVGTAVTAMLAASGLRETARSAVETRVTEAQEAIGALERMRGIDVTNDATRFAREEEAAQVFDKPAGDAQRQAAFAAVEVFNARLAKDGHKADIVAVLGANGHVVARDLNIGVLFDEDLKAKYPAVGKALDGTAHKDVWLFDGHMYRVAVAPIRSKAGQVTGALLVGYVTSAKDAALDRKRLGVHVAYFLDGKLHASSFAKEGVESLEEKNIADAIFGSGKPAETAQAGELSKNFQLTVAGEPYVGATGPLPGNLTRSRSGFVVLSSVTAAQAGVGKVQALFYSLGLLGLLCVLGATLGTALRFVRPLDSIETGVAEVINGNHDYTFESTSPDYEGLANALNVMVARLTGRPDPTDDDLGGSSDGGSNQRWQTDIAVDAANATGPQLSPENARIAAEPEADYIKRTFDEYIAARKQHNEPTEGLTLETFTQKLRANEDQLKGKYGSSRVRFKVVIKDGQTTLKPIPIP
jgi:hypothetical protein